MQGVVGQVPAWRCASHACGFHPCGLCSLFSQRVVFGASIPACLVQDRWQTAAGHLLVGKLVWAFGDGDEYEDLIGRCMGFETGGR